MDEANYLYEWIIKNNKDLGILGSFKVFKCDNDAFIGYAAILPNDDLTEAEIEYMLLPNYWRQGYGSEITTKLLKIAREVDSIQTLVANVKPDNIGSKIILLKTGFAHCKFFENLDNGSPVEMFNKNIVY